MAEKDPINTDWLVATLEDAREELEHAIEALGKHPEEAEDIMENELQAAYAKLNYAVNTARSGARGLDELTDDEAVAFPTEEFPLLDARATSEEEAEEREGEA